MNNTFKVAIIGGGASGLFCAIELLSNSKSIEGKDIVILERNDRVGKKLIATGNGQGNLTNAEIFPDKYYGDKDFIRAFFHTTKEINLTKYFKNLGIYLSQEEDGKMYPKSLQANSVLDNIRYYLMQKGVFIFYNYYVESISKNKNIFFVEDKNQKITTENVVCAFGGSAGKNYGTDGSSYSLLTKFGHKLTKIYPSLVQLKVNLNEYKGLKGIKERVKLQGLSNGKIVKTVMGDLLFTDYGVSGSAIFNISSALQGQINPSINVEFLPNVSKENLKDILVEKSKLNFIPKEELLSGLINKQIGRIICKSCKNNIDLIVDKVKQLTFIVTGDLGFNYAQVTKGGVQTCDVSPITLQSKLVKNLYLVGELLDVDGDCGGYNLTFAFLSGILCAKSIKEQYNKGKANV